MKKSGKKLNWFNLLNYCLLSAVGLSMALPFLNLAAKAVSNEGAVIAGKVLFIPKGFQLDTIRYVLKTPDFCRSFFVTVTVTILGTYIATALTVMAAYPLSKKELKGRGFVLGLFITAMLFNGGTIPNYLLFRGLKLTNTIYALIFPGMLSVINVLLVKNYFESLPKSIEEAARIDGANDFYILVYIVMPMSVPVLAVVGLFYGVSYWGNYFAGMLYITEPGLRPLPLYLYELVTAAAREEVVELGTNIGAENVRAASILISALPILAIYPFCQRFLINGIKKGALKE